MGSRGRRSATYRKVQEAFRTGDYPCALRLPGCTGRGTTVDHDPPLHTVAVPEMWVGTYRPACPACQSRQGAAITNAKRRRARDWSW